MTINSGVSLEETNADREFLGRLIESAVDAHLASAAMYGERTLYYWRGRTHKADFTVRAGRRIIAIEVKGGRTPSAHAGTAAFTQAFKPQRCLLVGVDGIALDENPFAPGDALGTNE